MPRRGGAKVASWCWCAGMVDQQCWKLWSHHCFQGLWSSIIQTFFQSNLKSTNCHFLSVQPTSLLRDACRGPKTVQLVLSMTDQPVHGAALRSGAERWRGRSTSTRWICRFCERKAESIWIGQLRETESVGPGRLVLDRAARSAQLSVVSPTDLVVRAPVRLTDLHWVMFPAVRPPNKGSRWNRAPSPNKEVRSLFTDRSLL